MRNHAKASSAIAALCCCGIVFGCLSASPALASKGVVGFFGSAASGTGAGEFSSSSSGPGGMAVNQAGNDTTGAAAAAAGDVYVVDRGNNRVEQFSASGAFKRAFGLDVGGAGVNVCTSTCTAGTSSSDNAGMSEPQGVAVDQATGLLYVTDQGNRRIDVISASGVFQGAFGQDVDATTPSTGFEFCPAADTCQAGATSGTDLAGAFGFELGYLAIAPSGDVLVADKENRRVDQFTPTVNGSGEVTAVAFTRAFGWNVAASGDPGDTVANEFEICTTTCQQGASNTGTGGFGSSGPVAIAVGSTGASYAVDPSNNRVQKFSSTATPEGAFASTSLSGDPAPIDVAVNRSNDRVFAIKPCNETICPPGSYPPPFSTSEDRVLELDSAGNLLSTNAAGAGITSATSLAESQSSGGLYLTVNQDSNHGALALGTVVPPAAAVDAGSGFTHTDHTATFTGTVNPTGFTAGWRFEYSTDGSSWISVPATDTTLSFTDSAAHAVSQDLSGLVGSQLYHVRLVATKPFAAGSATSAETTFTTEPGPPVILGTGIEWLSITPTGATVRAEVNPENQGTSYQVEYVTEAQFEESGFAGASLAPAGINGIGHGNEALAVSPELSGLDPDTTYYFRVVATNPSGASYGPELSFATYPTAPSFASCPNEAFRIGPSAALSDCRAYEQASPVDKNGNDIEGSFSNVVAAADGSAISFPTKSPLPAGKGGLYAALRGAGGWFTSSVGGGVSFAPDLSAAYTQTGGQFEPARTVILERPGGATETMISATQSGQISFSLDGATPGAGETLFTSTLKLTPEATNGAQNLYLYASATGDIVLAGVLPDSACGAPPCVPAGGAFAGSYEWRSGALDKGVTNSRYSSLVEENVLSNGGDRVWFTAPGNGKIFLRTDPLGPGATTVQVNASQKTNGAGPGGTDSGGPQPAAFMGATPSGSKAFFTSHEELTNDATTGQPSSIGRADIGGANPDQNFLTTTGKGIAVDGSHIYWAIPAANAIGRADLDGANPDPSFITGASNPQGIAVDASHIYWTNAGDGANGHGSIGRADLDGSANLVPGSINNSFITGASNPQGIAVNATDIYWANVGTADSTRRIGHAAIGGGSVTETLTFSGSTTSGTSPGIALDGSHIYWSQVFGEKGYIARANLDGANPDPNFIATAPNPAGVALDPTDSYIYWADGNSIGRATIDGADVNQSFVSGASKPQGLAANASHLYWANISDHQGNDLYAFQPEGSGSCNDAGGCLTDLSFDSNDLRGADVQAVLGASDDGDYVYFVANGVLASNPGARDATASGGDCSWEVTGGGVFSARGTCNLYLWHNGATTFIAPLDLDPPGGGTGVERSSDDTNWVNNSVETIASRVSANGHALLFRSQLRQTSYDSNRGACQAVLAGCPELYRYDADSGQLDCVSCNPTGASPIAPPTLRSISTVTRSQGAWIDPRNLSADGARVFFESPDKLVPDDTNGDVSCPNVEVAGASGFRACLDVYEWEAPGTGTCAQGGAAYSSRDGGCLYLLSTGTGSVPALFGDASVSGDDAFIFDRKQLVPADQDSLIDVYDARAGGGLASQHQAAAAAACEADACRAAATSSPATQGAGTASFSGRGNPPAHHKPHRAKKHHKKRKHQRRAATHNRRPSR